MIDITPPMNDKQFDLRRGAFVRCICNFYQIVVVVVSSITSPTNPS